MAPQELHPVDTLKAPLLAKPQKAFAAAFVVLATVLAGCASGLGAKTYDASAPVGMVTRVEEGRIVGVHAAGIGRADISEFAYTIRLLTGELVSVEQPGAYTIPDGTPVVIEYGQRARVIPQNASIGYS